MSPPVIDLTAASFRQAQSGHRARLEAQNAAADARFDAWVASLGGFAGARFQALYAEAREFAGPDHCMEYLNMAQQVDEGRSIDLASDEAQPAMRQPTGAEIARELVNRLDVAAARRRRSAAIQLAADQAAIDAVLRQSAGLKLAMDELKADPRVAAILDADLSAEAPMAPTEVSAELRAAMGLASRPATRYEESLPPVGDLARAIGLRS